MIFKFSFLKNFNLNKIMSLYNMAYKRQGCKPKSNFFEKKNYFFIQLMKCHFEEATPVEERPVAATPVEPKPPLPRSVAESFSAGIKAA